MSQGKGGKQVRKSAIYLTKDEQASQHEATKRRKTYLKYNWSTTIVKETKQHIHEHM